MSDERPGGGSGGSWTLGAIRRMNLELEAVCQKPGCGWFGIFDTDRLIDELGEDFVLPDDGGDLTCGKCGGPVAFRLAYPHLDQDDPDQENA